MDEAARDRCGRRAASGGRPPPIGRDEQAGLTGLRSAGRRPGGSGLIIIETQLECPASSISPDAGTAMAKSRHQATSHPVSNTPPHHLPGHDGVTGQKMSGGVGAGLTSAVIGALVRLSQRTPSLAGDGIDDQRLRAPCRSRTIHSASPSRQLAFRGVIPAKIARATFRAGLLQSLHACNSSCTIGSAATSDGLTVLTGRARGNHRSMAVPPPGDQRPSVSTTHFRVEPVARGAAAATTRTGKTADRTDIFVEDAHSPAQSFVTSHSSTRALQRRLGSCRHR